MKHAIQDAATKTATTASGDLTRDWITPLLAGLGVTFSGAEWLGGVLLAIVGGIIAARFDSGLDTKHERQAFWLTVLAAFLVAHIAGVVSFAMFPTWPPQIAMVAGGFGSRFIIRFLLRALYKFESRGEDVGDAAADGLINRLDKDGGKKCDPS